MMWHCSAFDASKREIESILLECIRGQNVEVMRKTLPLNVWGDNASISHSWQGFEKVSLNPCARQTYHAVQTLYVAVTPSRCQGLPYVWHFVQIAVLVMLVLEAVTGQGVLGNWLKL